MNLRAKNKPVNINYEESLSICQKNLVIVETNIVRSKDVFYFIQVI